MRRSAAVATALLLGLVGAPGAAHAGDPLPTWPGAARPPASLRPLPVPRPGSPASDGLQGLRRYEQRNRLEDLRRDTGRRLEHDRLRDDPLTLERARRRWRAEDRQLDLQRRRELDAIEHGVEIRERSERAAERLPTGRPDAAPSSDESRPAFDRELREQKEREQIDRLRRDVEPRIWSGPGVRRWSP